MQRYVDRPLLIRRRKFDVRHYAVGALFLATKVEEQQAYVLIFGPLKSGKSTLMNILGCLDRPTEGHYEVAGTDVASLSSDELAVLRRDTFGFVFQRYNLLSSMTAAENVELPAIYAGATPKKGSEKKKAKDPNKFLIGFVVASHEAATCSVDRVCERRVYHGMILMQGGAQGRIKSFTSTHERNAQRFAQH